MTVLAEAIAGEISARETKRAELSDAIDHIDSELARLQSMAELATSLNGNGSAPGPAKPSRGRAQPGGRSTPSSGRNGGNAPDGRRPTTTRSSSGSAPSGTPRPARAPSSTGPRTIDPARVRELLEEQPLSVNGLMGALGLGGSPGQKAKLLAALEEIGASVVGKIRGGSAYGFSTPAETHPQPEAPVDWAYVARRVLDTIARGPLTAEALAEKIDAPLDVVTQQCGRLVREGKASQMADGTYVA